jgi:spore germination cell wall hydrolase CwlJ-like protein
MKIHNIIAIMLSALISMATFSAMTDVPHDTDNNNVNKITRFEIHALPRPISNSSFKNAEVECLASAMWHEAGNQSEEGQIAVAEVVLSRKASRSYPKNACSVIAQKNQFSFVRNGYIPPVPAHKKAKILTLAKKVIKGELESSVKGAMSFHAVYVKPHWNLPVAGRIGDHIFYRNKT